MAHTIYKSWLWRLLLFSVLITFCAVPRSHRFTHTYSIPQALRFVRQALLDRGYRIAIFDTTTGIIKTERSTLTTEDGSTLSYQISVTVVTTDELFIKVLPASARNVADEIMMPIIEALRALGFHPENVTITTPNP